jgi:hypothetical protein
LVRSTSEVQTNAVVLTSGMSKPAHESVDLRFWASRLKLVFRGAWRCLKRRCHCGTAYTCSGSGLSFGTACTCSGRTALLVDTAWLLLRRWCRRRAGSYGRGGGEWRWWQGRQGWQGPQGSEVVDGVGDTEKLRRRHRHRCRATIPPHPIVASLLPLSLAATAAGRLTAVQRRFRPRP